jgi:uncharacterized protein YneR
MQLNVETDAALRFKEEMDLKDGDFLQIFVKLYGHSIHPNYSLGIAKTDAPRDAALQTTAAGITFYVSEKDAWFFDGYRCTVALVNGEIDYVYEKL